MARTTISIPDSLKARMDDCDGINWSGVAQDAFERVIERETAKAQIIRGSSDMGAVVERLRKSRMDYEEKLHEQTRLKGVEAGANWARRHAEYAELDALATTAELEGEEHAAANIPVAIIPLSIAGDDRVDAIAEARSLGFREFWSDQIGLDDEDSIMAVSQPHFREGFVEGAVGVWEIVKDEI